MALSDKMMKIIGFDPTGDFGAITYYTTRRGRVVGYDKAPPLKPATSRQMVRRNRWRRAAECWQLLSPEQKEQWHAAARRARLRIHGYNLFLFFQTTQQWSLADAISRQSGINIKQI